jgi:hypothetical protein
MQILASRVRFATIWLSICEDTVFEVRQDQLQHADSVGAKRGVTDAAAGVQQISGRRPASLRRPSLTRAPSCRARSVPGAAASFTAPESPTPMLERRATTAAWWLGRTPAGDRWHIWMAKSSPARRQPSITSNPCSRQSHSCFRTPNICLRRQHRLSGCLHTDPSVTASGWPVSRPAGGSRILERRVSEKSRSPTVMAGSFRCAAVWSGELVATQPIRASLHVSQVLLAATRSPCPTPSGQPPGCRRTMSALAS